MQTISIRLALLWLFLVSSSVHAAPALNGQPAADSRSPLPAVVEGRASGPDVIVGDIFGLAQLGSSGTQVGLAMGTTACNNGDADLDFLSLPNTDHPVIAQNLYRMSGGATNEDRFEQVGQSWVKHTFAALEQNDCGFGCIPSSSGGTRLGAGCSNPESASSNGVQSNLGSRAWVNPFTGIFPANPNPDDHSGHAHSGVTHRVVVESSDLAPTQNVGSTYYAEAQYVTPNEFAWCQTHPAQCNMSNNVSYRRFTVNGTTSFSFVPVGSTVRASAALTAWTGAIINAVEPAPGADGRAFVGCKVTNPSAGVWHYEYAVYNENLDRAVQSFTVPLGCGIAVGNLGFHAPLNPPGIAHDGTAGDAGFSNAPWTSSETATALTWNTETLAQNPNANAVRWGTLYNFRFDSNRPPHTTSATIGFFKTGAPTSVAIQAPSPETCVPLQLISAVSRKTHGAAGEFEIDLPLTGETGVECRNGGGDYTIAIRFNNMIVSGKPSVTGGTGKVAGSSITGDTMMVELTGVADVQRLTVTLSGVADNAGQILPDTAVRVNLLIGDINGNKTVNATDIAQAKEQSGSAVSAANFRSDVNGNGAITAADVAQAKANAGHVVP